MSHIIEPWVRETTTSTGLSDLVLSGGFDDSMTFDDVMANGDTCDYAVWYGPTGGNKGPREEGFGTFVSASNTLQRTRVYRARHANGVVDQNKVTFPTGAKTVIMTFASARAAMLITSIAQLGGDGLLGPAAVVQAIFDILNVNDTNTDYQVNIGVDGDNAIAINNKLGGVAGPNFTFKSVGLQKWSIQLHPELSDKLYVVNNAGTNGVFMAQSDTSWQSNSDARLKEDVKTVDVLKRLRSGPYRAVTYSLKTDPEKRHMGVIAQEVAQCFPELVAGEDDGKPEVDQKHAMSTWYDRHGPLALYGLKQMLTEVDGLKQKVGMLENELLKARQLQQAAQRKRIIRR